MRVLFILRKNCFENIAGDTIQVINTLKHIRKYNVEVVIANSDMIDTKNYDIVHLFNLQRVKDIYPRALDAFERSPVVLSPIYWSMKEYLNNADNRDNREWWDKNNDLRCTILKNCNMILPNSVIEQKQIKRDFSISCESHVVPNGVDKCFYYENIETRPTYNQMKDYILCVGRIHPRKNQAFIIKALSGLDTKVLIVGPASDKKYFKYCMEIAGNNIVFIDEVKVDELINIYRGAKVHVLPSWMETPGLVNLEAGLAGCNIVTTDRGSTQEYFENHVLYCNPTDEKLLFKSVLKALEKPCTDNLQKHILNNYTWDKAALETYNAYCQVLRRTTL